MRKLAAPLVLVLLYLIIIIGSALIAFGPVSNGETYPVAALTPHSKYWSGQYLGQQQVGSTSYLAGVSEAGDLLIVESRSGRTVLSLRYGLQATNLIVRDTTAYVLGVFSGGVYRGEGFQIWNLANPTRPVFIYGWSLREGEQMTSLTVLGQSVYVTAYYDRLEFVETGLSHIVRPGESLWSIARDYLCGGYDPCAAAKWVQLLELNQDLISFGIRPDGSSYPVLYAGLDIRISASRYERSFISTLYRYELVGGEIRALTSRKTDREKFEVVFPDPRVAAVRLWSTAEDGSDRDYLLDARSLQVDPNLKGD